MTSPEPESRERRAVFAVGDEAGQVLTGSGARGVGLARHEAVLRVLLTETSGRLAVTDVGGKSLRTARRVPKVRAALLESHVVPTVTSHMSGVPHHAGGAT